jgi:magnesium-transporting ATPase (P-type)
MMDEMRPSTRVPAREPGGGDPGRPVSASPGRNWHAQESAAVAAALGASLGGLSDTEARTRLEIHGPNRLRPPPAPARWQILARQFRSPLITVLLVAAAIAMAVGELSDAGFIAAVLLLNALIGYLHEHGAEREVQALHRLVRARARVRRGRRAVDIDGENVVPGDLLLLESGARVIADVRLLDTHGLRIDQSLLTGESIPVDKDGALVLSPDAPLAERRNMAFAGSMVASGRGAGLVVATGLATEVGAIADELAEIRREPTPLLQRMERFARLIGVATLVLAAVLVALGLARGGALAELMLAAVALAVSAIPEGLPIALTVALAVAVSRMAKRRVVVRQLPAVEALGSCGVIATDKTGTLTRNELTVERVVTSELDYRVSGRGYAPEGEVLAREGPTVLGEHPRLFRLLRAACLANEASLAPRRDQDGPDAESERWEWSGDPTDVALLSLGLKAGCDPVALREVHGLIEALGFEPERRYAATLHRAQRGSLLCVKGAPERVMAMCDREYAPDDGTLRPVDGARVQADLERLMQAGYRVLAIAESEREAVPEASAVDRVLADPADLVFLGLVAMTDPPRDGVSEALAQCRRAGVRVVMITGDHATTACSIATRIGLADESAGVLSGAEIESLDDAALSEQLGRIDVVARATPTDKLRVVNAWQRRGALVAVTGDGVNDAPALRQANLGVAMGHEGTDVAREASDLVITDDNFASIVAGIEEGRVAYDNVRKATYLLVSTGLGEVILVTTTLALGLPIPFTAVQLLWLNLVTNGIQDVALAFEPAEPNILDRSPRPPRERIFDPLMMWRTLLAGAVFGGVGLAWWWVWMERGVPVEEARNLMVQLFVLFEVFHIGNARSERISLLRLSPLSNPLLFAGTLGAIGVHVTALFVPFLQELLGVAPLDPHDWTALVASAAVIIVVMELHKAVLHWRATAPGRRAVG